VQKSLAYEHVIAFVIYSKRKVDVAMFVQFCFLVTLLLRFFD